MASIVYSNGRYLPRHQAQTSVFDRAHLFADGIYEVIWVANRALVDWQDHHTRLLSSLAAVSLSIPWSPAVLRTLIFEVIRKNNLNNGFVYLQINRKHSYTRDHRITTTEKGGRPALMISAHHAPPPQCQPLKVITLPDERWRHCDIKSTALIKAVLSKQQAQQQGAHEAWFFDKDTQAITEGASCNAWMVTHNGTLCTHPADNRILHGVARQTLLKLCQRHKLPVQEQAFTLDALRNAREVFLTSTTLFVSPVSHIDDVAVGNGKVGETTQRLFDAYLHHCYPSSSSPDSHA
ncbi:MAG: aminotransferase class IV [Alphaproteobacteria bacterium GM202ARS2]|nr:aminotransferase class IV [Alphaproteobacteria bacterium GM202ARS2]